MVYVIQSFNVCAETTMPSELFGSLEKRKRHDTWFQNAPGESGDRKPEPYSVCSVGAGSEEHRREWSSRGKREGEEGPGG